MHKIKVGYHDVGRFGYDGYRVKICCNLTKSTRWIGMFQELTDAMKFANWKATELGIEVEVEGEKKKKEKK